MQKKLILVHGTSADPPHRGHGGLILNGVQSLVSMGLNVVEVMVIPVYWRNSFHSNRKEHLPLTFEHRYAMCSLEALAMEKQLAGKAGRVVVSRLEESLAKSRQKPNVTAETLATLRQEIDPGVGLVFLLGGDLVSGDTPVLGEWHELGRLIRLTAFAVCPRPGYPRNGAFLEELQKQGARCVFLDSAAPQDIASRRIKERLLAGEDPSLLSQEGLISEAIACYIKENSLADVWRRLERGR